MDKLNNDILRLPVRELDISQASKDFLQRLDISTMEEFVKRGWAALKSDPEFDYRPFNKIISYLSKRDLVHLMEI